MLTPKGHATQETISNLRGEFMENGGGHPKMVEGNMGLPEVEFEGPLGQFWSMKEVPMEALVKGITEIIHELERRGYKDQIILELLRRTASNF